MKDAGRILIDHAALAHTTGLSKREAEVLRHLALGWTDRQISDYACLSLKTVHRHVANILAKLGAQNRAHAVAKSLLAGLIQLRASDAARYTPIPERRRANPLGQTD